MMGEISQSLSKEKHPVKVIIFPTVASTLGCFMEALRGKCQKKMAVEEVKMGDEDFGFGHFLDDDDGEDGTSSDEGATTVK